MTAYEKAKRNLRTCPKIWLVTGVAGFIGSNLLETLLKINQTVVGLDNFSTGKPANLNDVRALVSPEQWARFKFTQGDIRSLRACQSACAGIDYVLHQAALGSVPRSIEDPIRSHDTNVTGFLNLLVAARDQKVRRFVYASSSAVYGDEPALPKREPRIGQPLSPYAATKSVNETYAGVFARCYGLATIGLRYFNVYGARQDPEGPYAAVIPKWIEALLLGEPVYIYGDGDTSRDFCCVADVVQGNLLAATTTNPDALNRVYNLAFHQRTTLNRLFRLLCEQLETNHPQVRDCQPIYRPFRTGDVRHSLADIGRAKRTLGYRPAYTVAEGIGAALGWYLARCAAPLERQASMATTQEDTPDCPTGPQRATAPKPATPAPCAN